MISDSGPTVAAAIGAAVAGTLGEGVIVTVFDHVPETAAAPCAWIEFTDARYEDRGGWQITWDATIVADAALGPIDAAAQLAAMTDAVLAMPCPGVQPRAMTARGGGLVTRLGDIPHPCTVVTVPQLNQVC